VFSARPVTEVDIVTAFIPDPMVCWAVELFIVNVGSVPYSNQALVERPFAITTPFRVAPFVPTIEAFATSVIGTPPLVASPPSPPPPPQPINRRTPMNNHTFFPKGPPGMSLKCMKNMQYSHRLMDYL
jgi:hypothetical protein